MTEIIDVLTKWSFYLGLGDKVKSLDYVAVVQFLVNNYGFLYCDEITLAMNLSLNGTLEVENKTFGSFSVLYVSQIINAYLDHKSHVFRSMSERRDSYEFQKEHEVKQLPPTATEQVANMKDIIATMYDKYRATGELYDPFSIVHGFLKRTGRLKIPADNHEEIRNKAQEKAVNYRNQNMKTLADAFTKPTETELQNLYNTFGKQLCVAYVFDQISDLQAFLSEINETEFQ